MSNTVIRHKNTDFLSGDQLEVFKAHTGIQDEQELRQHILKVQADALKVHPYACIQGLVWTRFKISRLPNYAQLLRLGRERTGAIYLDIGCCIGNDLRQAVADGFPAENTIGSDLYPEFLQLGHQMYRTTPEQFPAQFIPGDALSQDFLKIVPPFYSPPNTLRPDLSSLTTLTPLAGHVSAIHASSFFHLFDEPQQLHLAKALAGLLSPEPGSFLFGEHGSRPVKGYRTEAPPRDDGTYQFCHCPESWTELWDGGVFEKGKVKVETYLKEIERKDLTDRTDVKFWIMAWSVTRL